MHVWQRAVVIICSPGLEQRVEKLTMYTTLKKDFFLNPIKRINY